MFIAATRLPSQWLSQNANVAQAAQLLEQGNPLDRSIYCALIVFAIVILVSRSFEWGDFLGRNPALAIFLCYCLLSVLWSDFTLISLKRWFRDLGDYLLILVILSDSQPIEAIRTVFRRLFFISISLSIVFIKYFPALGMHYSVWTGAPEYVGVTMSKNMLGSLCMISILIFCWDSALIWPERKSLRAKQTIAINIAFLMMTVWLLHLSKSDTSLVCAAIGCSFILLIHSKWGGRNRTAVKLLMPGSFLLYLILNFGFNMNGQFAQELGRDPNLTGRTEIWHTLLSLHTNPILGTGYESFWLGPRLLKIWQLRGKITEAHDGYLDVYLTLGIAGLILLGTVLVSSYRTICSRLDRNQGLASLGAAVWILILFYNVTEAAFKNGTIWMVFLLVTTMMPPQIRPKRGSSAPGPKQGPMDRRIREVGPVSSPRAEAILR